MQAIHDAGVRGDDLHEPEPEAAEPATPGSPSSARGQPAVVRSGFCSGLTDAV
jgi:hypothetical protein